MNKQIRLNNDARVKVKKGLDIVADTVKLTAGPRGRNVAMEREYNTPVITNDGVSVAKEIELSDRFENIGAAIVKDVASKTNEVAGDGTTTSVILLQAFINEGMKYLSVENEDINPVEIKDAMHKAAQEVMEHLKKQAKPITTDEDIFQVALISSESKEIAKIVSDIIKQVGKEGSITVQESKQDGIESEVAQGLELPNGYVSPYFALDREKMETVFSGQVPVLVTNRKIDALNAKELGTTIERLMNEKISASLVVISDEISKEVLNIIINNSVNTPFKVVCIKAPGFVEGRQEWLEDIAAFTGATVVTEESKKEFSVELLGKCSQIKITKDKTIIIGGDGDILLRSAQIQTEIKNEKSDYTKGKLRERLARLGGRVGVIRVGASTETEMKYLKDKVDDTVNAVKAAIEEGVVQGGGVAFAQISELLKGDRKGNELIGYSIIEKGILAPLWQIASNAGKKADMIVENVIQGKGYDAKNDVYLKDMIKAGIIDPVKVTKTALKNAVSAAGTLLTMGAVIVYDEDRTSGKDN